MPACRAWHCNYIGSLPAIISRPFIKHDLTADQKANRQLLHAGQRELAPATIKPAALVKARLVGEIILIMHPSRVISRGPIKTAIEPQLSLDQGVRPKDNRCGQLSQTLHHPLMCLL